MNRTLRFFLIALSAVGLMFAFWTPQANAQSPYELSAQVDASEITTDDTVTLTLMLTTPDGNAPRLNLPALDGFNILGSQTASQYSVVNGTATSSMSYAYQLQPTRTGELKIPSLKLDLNGQLLATDPLTVNVTQGNGTPSKRTPSRPSPFGSAFGGTSPFGNSAFGSLFGNDPFNDPFFTDPFNSDMFGGDLSIQAATSKPSVYVGEPLKYTVRVQSDAMMLGEPEYSPPQFTGFWAHQPPLTQRGMNGTAITTLLFPTKAGELTIDPAKIRADGGFFSNALERETEPVHVNVKPLPQGAPKEFNGAVGQFEISSTPDTTSTRVGEPVTVRVEIKGAGNFDTLSDPQWVQDSDWRAFDAKADTQSNVANGKLVGTRTYERTLIPTREGVLTIPATKFAYFDPADEQYHVVETDAIQVNVAPGDPSVAQSFSAPNQPADTANANVTNASALAPARAQLTTAATLLVAQPLFLGLFLIPLGIVAFDIGLGLRKRHMDNSSAERRASRALKNAKRGLEKARRAKDVSAAVSKVVLTYLEDKSNRSLLGVPHSAIAQLLLEHGIPQEQLQDVLVLLLAGESSEFGNVLKTTPERTVLDALVVLNALESEWTE